MWACGLECDTESDGDGLDKLGCEEQEQHLMTSRYKNGTREPRDWTISVTSRVRTEAEPGSLSRFESACALTKLALL